MADLLYYESGYIDDSYFVYTADAESLEAGSFSMTATVGVIREAAAELAVTTEIQATISHINGADLFAMSNAALEAAVNRIRDNNIEASSAFSLATDGARIRYVSAEEDAAFSMTADNLRVRYDEAALDAAFSLTANNERTRSASASLESNTALSSQEDYLKLASANLDSSTTVYCDPIRIAGGVVVEASGTWTVTTDLSATISHIEGADLSAFSNTSLTATALRIQESSVALESTTEQTTTANQTYSIQAEFSASTSQTTNFDRTRSTSAQLELTSTVSAQVGKIIEFSSTENAAFSPSITCVITVNSFAVLEATASMSATVDVAKTATANLNSTSSQTTAGTKLPGTTINLTGAFTQAVTGTIRNKRPWDAPIRLNASLSSANPLVGAQNLYIPLSGVSSSGYASYQNTNLALPNPGTDFVIEFFYYYTTNNTNKYILQAGSNSFSGFLWQFALSGSFRYLQFNYYGSATKYSLTSSTSLLVNTWYFIRAKRVGSTITLEYSAKSGSTWSTITSVATATSSVDAQPYTSTVLLFGSSTTSNIDGYYDEFYMASGTSTGGQQQATLGTRLTNGNADTTRALFHFDTSYIDDITGTFNASAALTSNATISAQPYNFTKAQAALTSTSTVSAQPDNNIKTASANLSANGFVIAANGRIRPEVADLTSQFTLYANAGKKKEASATLSSNFTLTASALDLDLAQSNLTSAFSLALNARRIPADGKARSTTEALLHLNSYPFVDEMYSGTPAVYPATAPTLVTGKFGNAFATGDQYVYEQTNINLYQSSFVADCWYYLDTTGNGYDTVILNVGGIAIIALYKSTYHSDHSWGLTDNQVYVNYAGDRITAPPSSRISSTIISPGSWNHFLITRSGTTFKLYINGTLDLTWTDSNDYNGNISIYGGYNAGYRGKIDEIRLKKDVYQSTNFTAPTGPYTEFAAYAKEGVLDVVLTATLTASVQKVKPASASLSSAFTQVTNNARKRDVPASLALTTTLSASGLRAAVLQSYQTSQFTQTTQAVKKVNPGASLQATATESVITSNSKIVGASAQLSSQFTQVTNNTRKRNVPAGLTTTATTTATILKIQGTSANLQVQAFELAAVVKTGQGFIHFDSVATTNATAVKTTNLTKELTATASLTASSKRFRSTPAVLTTTATVTCSPTYFRRNEVFATTTSTMSITAVKTARTSSQDATTASLTANTLYSRTANTTANLSLTASLTAINDTFRNVSATLTATTEQIATPGVYLRTEAHLEAFDTVMAIGRRISFDKYLQIRIKPETRYLLVKEESRALVIESETRVNKIKGQP